MMMLQPPQQENLKFSEISGSLLQSLGCLFPGKSELKRGPLEILHHPSQCIAMSEDIRKSALREGNVRWQFMKAAALAFYPPAISNPYILMGMHDRETEREAPPVQSMTRGHGQAFARSRFVGRSITFCSGESCSTNFCSLAGTEPNVGPSSHCRPIYRLMADDVTVSR